MTPLQFHLCIELLMAVLAGIYWTRIRRTIRNSDLLVEKFKDSTDRFAKHKRSLEQEIDKLQTQLEGAGAAWTEADAAATYKDREITGLCNLIKKMRTQLIDKEVEYNHLVQQYNSLTSKMPRDGDMPT